MIWTPLQQRGVYPHLPLWDPSDCSEISAWVWSVSNTCRKLRCLREKRVPGQGINILASQRENNINSRNLIRNEREQLAYIHFSLFTHIFPSVQLHFITNTKRNKFSFQKIRSKIKFAFVKKGSRITLELHWSKGGGMIKQPDCIWHVNPCDNKVGGFVF